MTARVYWNPGPYRARLISAHRPAATKTGQVAQRIAPRRTGRLARSTRVVFAGFTRATLGVFGVPYAVPVIRGQAPHEIKALNAEALSTPFGPRESVQHPGASPRPYLQAAARSFPGFYFLEARRRVR